MNARMGGKFFRNGSVRSFSLVELLIAIAISSAVALMFNDLVVTTEKVVSLSSRRLTATAEARLVLDRMARDFRNMPFREDMDYFMEEPEKTGEFLRFFIKTKGPGGNRKLSQVSYKLDYDNRQRITLYRGIRGYRWEQSGFMGLTADKVPVRLSDLPAGLSVQRGDYQPISRAVLKVGMCYQLKNTGKFTCKVPMYPMGSNGVQYLQMTNIANLGVTLVLVDAKMTQKYGKDELSKISDRMTDTPEGIMPLAHWNTNLEYKFGTFARDIPPDMAKTIKVYQRLYKVNLK